LESNQGTADFTPEMSVPGSTNGQAFSIVAAIA
jgi:hypothetical protein